MRLTCPSCETLGCPLNIVHRLTTKGLEQRQVLITNSHTFQIKGNTIIYNRNHLQPKIRLDKWKRQVPPKRPYACTKLHGVIFQMTEILTKFSSHSAIHTASSSRCARTTCAWTRVRARTRVSVHVDGFTQPKSKLRDHPQPWDRVTRHKVGTWMSSSTRLTQSACSKPVNEHSLHSWQ